MEVTPLTRVDSPGSGTPEQSELDRNELLRNALTTVRTLNGLNIPDREFSVVRDPQSQKFVIRVIDRTTGDVLDQFPPEDILQLLSQFAPPNEPKQGLDE
jgi:uncharacterized FlaG/YvyC family protein